MLEGRPPLEQGDKKLVVTVLGGWLHAHHAARALATTSPSRESTLTGGIRR